MPQARPTELDPPVDVQRDHILGDPGAELTLVQYGSYADFRCRAVHTVVEGLRNRFGDRMRYVFRHLPVEGKKDALRAAEVSERVAAAIPEFKVHMTAHLEPKEHEQAHPGGHGVGDPYAAEA